MSALNVIDVCSDASVAYEWFHADGDDPVQVEASRSLALLPADGVVTLWVLDLTRYEVANASLFGSARISVERVTTVLDALAEICPIVEPTVDDLHEAARLAVRHRLTMYDATYAAAARSRGAELATLDKSLLKAGLGRRPSEIVEMVRLGARSDFSR